MDVWHRIVSVSLVCLTVFVSIMFVDVHPVSATVLQPHAPILIDSNNGFTTTNGVTGGSGTATDPYIIEGWEIASSSDYGIRIQGTVDGYGRPGTTAHFVIRNVYVHDSVSSAGQAAVDIMGVANGLLENMTISKNKAAISVYYSQNVTIANNLVQLNGFGIGVGAYDKNVAVVGNKVLSNSYGGIGITYSGNIAVLGNIVDNDGTGISGIRFCGCLFVGNTISNNRIGLEVNVADGPVFHNNFVNNAVQAEKSCGVFGPQCPFPFFDDGYPGGGNYWSDYAAVDNCSGPNQDVCLSPDGIADQPRIVSPCPVPCELPSLDRYPLMKPFAPAVSGLVSFRPTTIESQSNGRYLTALVELPNGYNASNLRHSSIRLNGTIAIANVAPVSQPNGAKVLIVRFNMTQVKALMSRPGNYVLQVTGNLLTSTNFKPFHATATVRLLSP